VDRDPLRRARSPISSPLRPETSRAPSSGSTLPPRALSAAASRSVSAARTREGTWPLAVNSDSVVCETSLPPRITTSSSAV
jgi:hypothetical protein